MGTHLIHRQILDLRYSDESRAKVAMNQWSDRFHKQWMPVLQEVLDELDRDGKWIRLDRVEIDLGKIGEKLSPEVLRQKLKDALKTQLLRQIPVSQSPLSKAEKPKSLFPQDDRKPLELVDYLLRNGRKPWWASHSKKEGIRSLILKILEEKPRELSNWLRPETFTPIMLFRLQNHLNHGEIQRLISLVFPDKRKEIEALVKSLILAFSPEVYPKNKLEIILEKSFLEAFLLKKAFISNPVSKWIKTHFLKSSISSLDPEDYTVLLAELIQDSSQGSFKTQVLEKVWKKWTQTPIFKKSISSSINPLKSHAIVKAKFLRTSQPDPQLPNSEKGKKSDQGFKVEKMNLDETILISNSGLVLTAPFLPFFFKGLGLVENKQFVSKEAQNRAVLLLQALIDEEYSYDESDLILNKIICGIEPSEAIEVSFSPTELEKEEIKNLLDSMVSQWTALKSTSGESMAKGFFPREGSLKRIGTGYQLTVPRLSIDILLNRLPWAISIIKLPWMNETLFTEW